MNRDYRFIIPGEGGGQRLDRFLGGCISEVSREKIKRAIHDGQCRVQGLTVTTPGTRLVPGQEVTLALALPPTGIIPEDGDISVLWHDAHMLVLNKAAGITVHPCPSCPQGTLVQRLASHFPQLAQQEGQRPGIVHRLDKDTSGLLVVALTEEARLRLSALFAAREITKEYLALVRGVPPQEGDIREPLGRHPLIRVKMAVVPENRGGKPAHSRWRVLWAHPRGTFSLICVRIFTGRTHQIRVHMAHLGFPLWGDALYGAPSSLSGTHDAHGARDAAPAPRQMLHAWKLSLPHPISGAPLSFTCPPPPDMLSTALQLTRRMRRVVLTGLPGCGKSALLRRLALRGVPVWSADAVVAKLYAPGADAHRFLADRFGQRFVPSPQEPVDRAALRCGMRDDPWLRQEVETAVHAMVRHSLDTFWHDCAATHARTAAAEVPLFLESGWTDADDTTLVGVACAPSTRHHRLREHRGWSDEQCQSMDGWQWPEKRKLAACHTVVDNNGDEVALDKAADALLASLETQEQAREEALARQLTAIWTEQPGAKQAAASVRAGDPNMGDKGSPCIQTRCS